MYDPKHTPPLPKVKQSFRLTPMLKYAILPPMQTNGLQDGSSEVIYIPTEAGIPILEAGKRDD